MKRLVIALCLAASIAGFPPAALSDQGETKFQQVHRDWVSLKVCFVGFCMWRAMTGSLTSNDEAIALDFYDNGISPTLTLIRTGVSISSMESWTENTDVVKVKIRVDNRPINEVWCNRELNRGERSLYWTIPPLPEIIADMRSGNTLRIQSAVNGTKYTRSFSLRGAMSAIDRARRNAESSSRPAPRSRTDDDYFSDNAPVRNHENRI